MDEVPKGHIKTNVQGAPFRIGDRVRVVKGTDETFDRRFLGRVGIVEHFEYSCGCGQIYPNDPMIGVEFRGARCRIRKGAVEEFWQEELKLLDR